MLNYTEYKHKTSKEWITFVHGAGGSSSIWFKQIRSFSEFFNVLVLDLRGHGNSNPALKDTFNEKYTFDAITNDIVEVLNHLKIKESHFSGISLGTILIRNIAENHPKRVISMIMGGAIMQLNLKSQILMRIGVLFKSVVPYLVLYKLFAFIIMPRKNHKKSRLIFVNEAKKLYQKEFVRWFKLTSEINPLLHFFRTKDTEIPTFYIMGEEDHLFLPAVKKVVSQHLKSSLLVIKNCGHVVNIEQAQIFNNESINFIKKLKLAPIKS
ncbi:alpha/beta hydrolase [uncultured Lutibacter sp.]|uniref:alpha/beta fold hydrolase n=1 Tax=uncultured Lutibacter sp. TaxID=437739 RepID=UPI002634C8C0|nr:alpha/beta hydrolase [uncultured Lutibacter sp.]